MGEIVARESLVRLTVLLLCLATPRGVRAIDLGGVEVPRERFVVFLLIGHCSMAGIEPDGDTDTDPRAWNYQLADETHADVVGWIPARDPLHASGNWDLRAGPGMPLLKRLIAQYPDDYYFGIIQNAESHASVADTYCHGCRLYDELINAAVDVAPDVTFGGVVAMLGQNDSYSSNDATRFAERFTAMVQDMRADLGAPQMPAFIGRYEENAEGAASNEYWEVVRDQIWDIPDVLTEAAVNDYLVPADEFWDEWRLSRQGHINWSNNLVDEVIVPGGDGDWNHFWYPAVVDEPPPVDPPPPENLPPTAVISVPAVVALAASVNLDASGSHDDDSIVAFEWSFGDDATDTGESVSHAWSTLGTYVVTLTVTDSAGASDQALAEVEVVETAEPAITILQPAAGERLATGATVSIVWQARFLDDVKISFSNDDGESWEIIDFCDTGGDCWGAFSWAVPETPSEHCRIAIEGYNGEARALSPAFAIHEDVDGPLVIVGGCSHTQPGFAIAPAALLLMAIRRIRRKRSRPSTGRDPPRPGALVFLTPTGQRAKRDRASDPPDPLDEQAADRGGSAGR